jgi:hypothetical protein
MADHFDVYLYRCPQDSCQTLIREPLISVFFPPYMILIRCFIYLSGWSFVLYIEKVEELYFKKETLMPPKRIWRVFLI